MSDSLYWIHYYLFPSIWYSSDFFYWILYFSAFILKLNKPLVPNKQLASSQHCGTVRRFFNDFNYTFNSFYMFLAERAHAYVGPSLNFRFVFKLTTYVCLVGAFLKTWLNLYDLLDSSSDILSIIAK